MKMDDDNKLGPQNGIFCWKFSWIRLLVDSIYTPSFSSCCLFQVMKYILSEVLSEACTLITQN